MISFLYLLVVGIIVFIIVKHFTSVEKNINEYDFDRLVEDKKRSLRGESTRVDQLINSKKKKTTDPYLEKIFKDLEWGGGDILDKELSRDLSSFLECDVKFVKVQNIIHEIIHQSKNKNDFLSKLSFEAFKTSFIQANIFRVKNLSSQLFNSLYLLSLGKVDEVFTKFDGSLASLRIKVNKQEQAQLKHLNIKDVLQKMMSFQKSIERLVLLNEEKVETLARKAQGSKEEYRKVLKTYHPDRMDLHIIPKKYHEKFLKIYSEQFSQIKSKLD